MDVVVPMLLKMTLQVSPVLNKYAILTEKFFSTFFSGHNRFQTAILPMFQDDGTTKCTPL